LNDERQTIPLPDFPSYPKGVIPRIDPKDAKPLMKMLNKAFKMKGRISNRGWHGRTKKTKFF